MSRGAMRYLPPLELNGIQYEQVVLEDHDLTDIERRCGFMRAREISTQKILWEVQVYKVSREDICNENGEPWGFHPYTFDRFFRRFKFMPDQKNILVENEARERYFVNIETQEVREATDADFPPEKIFKPYRPNSELLPLFHRGVLYMQDMQGFYDGTGNYTGRLVAYDAKTMKYLWRKQIYLVPFDDELENFTDECYIIMMDFANHAKRDIFIMNAREEVYCFNIRSHEIYQLKDNECYEDVRYRWRDRIRYFFEDFWDFITFSKPWREDKYSPSEPRRNQEDAY